MRNAIELMKFARNMSEKLFFPTLFFTFNLRDHHPRNQWEDKFLSFVTVEAKVGSIEGSRAQISSVTIWRQQIRAEIWKHSIFSEQKMFMHTCICYDILWT